MYGTGTSGKTERVQLTPQPGDSGRQKLLAFSRQSRFTGNIQYTIMSRAADKSRTRTIRCPQYISPVKRARGNHSPAPSSNPPPPRPSERHERIIFPFPVRTRSEAAEKRPEKNTIPPGSNRRTVQNKTPVLPPPGHATLLKTPALHQHNAPLQ